MSTLPNLKILPFGGAGAVQDTEQLKVLADFSFDSKILSDETITKRFLAKYQEWTASSTTNTIIGLDGFPYACYTNATTEAFDKFYLKNSQRRFRCFRGEYMYHILSWRNCFPDWRYLEDESLTPNDAVVVSFPFSDTGDRHAGLDDILEQATELGVPVLLDMAYFGICSGLDFDLTWPCITDVTFSMSKSFPVSHARIGMRLTRVDDDDPLFVANKTNYCNRAGAAIGLHMLERFGPDYISKKYKDLQYQWCQKLGAEPSPAVIFGLGDARWNAYNRGAGNHRLCFNKYLGSGRLPDELGI